MKTQLPYEFLQDCSTSWVLVAHTYNPSYSGGRDQEDQGSKPARQIVHKTLYLEKPI
jgi:hypothetical protein